MPKQELPFSVLIPVYKNDSAIFFDEAINSIFLQQSLKPKQIVIVVDGPIGFELRAIIDTWIAKSQNLFDVVRLEENLGLGKALNIGLANCKYDLIARMDSDDISHGDRFRHQINAFADNPSLDVCGTNIAEFSYDSHEISGIRALPMLHSEIVRMARFRNPINHPSVMFKKSKILSVNGYQDMPFFEDYFLWVRCIQGGCNFHNIQQNLVLMRGGEPQLSRRQGAKYALHEFKFFSKLVKIKFIKWHVFFALVFFRSSLRLLPRSIVKFCYLIIRKFW